MLPITPQTQSNCSNFFDDKQLKEIEKNLEDIFKEGQNNTRTLQSQTRRLKHYKKILPNLPQTQRISILLDKLLSLADSNKSSKPSLEASIDPDFLKTQFKKAVEMKLRTKILSEIRNPSLDKKFIFEALISSKSFSSQEIAEIIQENKEVYVEFSKYLYDKIQIGISDCHFFNFFDPKAKQSIEIFLNCNCAITLQTIKQVLYSQNYQYIPLILNQASDELLQTHFEELLLQLMEIENPILYDFFRNRAPQILTKCPLSLIEKAINQGHSSFTDWILDNGKILEQDQIEKLLSLAQKTYRLHTIEKLWGLLKNPKVPYAQFIGLTSKLNSDELFQLIFKYALFSPLDKIYNLTADHLEIASILPKVLKNISVLTRFPNQELAKELKKDFQNIDTYIESSLEYASENLVSLKNLSKKIKTASRFSLLNKIVKCRIKGKNGSKISTNLISKYVTPQIKNPQTAITFLITSQNKTIDSHTFFECQKILRYGWSLRHFAKLFFNDQSKEWEIPFDNKNVSYSEGSLQFFFSYFDNNGIEQERLPLTSLNLKFPSIHWNHTGSATICSLQNYLEQLHAEIFSLNLQNTIDKQFFLEKIPIVFWLGSTLCEFLRGTPHNVMMLLNLIYEYHHLPSPIPKLDHFYPDNTMLMMSAEQAYQNWSEIFEPLLDEALGFRKNSHQDLINILSKNGPLLEFCSDNIRNNANFVEIALKQNPDSLTFASSSVKQIIKEQELLKENKQ